MCFQPLASDSFLCPCVPLCFFPIELATADRNINYVVLSRFHTLNPALFPLTTENTSAPPSLLLNHPLPFWVPSWWIHTHTTTYTPQRCDRGQQAKTMTKQSSCDRTRKWRNGRTGERKGGRKESEKPDLWFENVASFDAAHEPCIFKEKPK